jgi:three-Cys-motif partner protein
MFIDPYGMQLSWKTLEAIRKTEAIDIWYLVSLQGLYRQAQTDRLGITPKKRAALTRMLGSDTWEAEWYTPKPLGGLFAFMSDVPIMGNTRCASVDDIEDYVGRRLKGLFPLVQGPLRLKTKNDKPGFALFFACSNPKREAFGLASRIAGYILKAGSSSQ